MKTLKSIVGIFLLMFVCGCSDSDTDTDTTTWMGLSSSEMETLNNVLAEIDESYFNIYSEEVYEITKESLPMSTGIKELDSYIELFNWLSENKNRIPIVIRYIIEKENEAKKENEKGEMDIRIAETIPLSYALLGDLAELYFPEIIDRIRSEAKFDLENGGLENYIDNANRRKVYLIRELLKEY